MQMKLNKSILAKSILAIILIAATAIFEYLYNSNILTQYEIVAQVESNVNSQIEVIQNRINELVDLTDDSLNYNSILRDLPNSFLYKSGSLVYWSNSNVIPNYKSISGSFDIKFIRTVRRDFIVIKRVHGIMELIVMIPIHQNYKIENKYFKTSFNKDIFPTQNLTLTQVNGSKHTICYQNECLFGIEFIGVPLVNPQIWSVISFITFFVAFILVIQVVYQYAEILQKRSFLFGLFSLSGSLFLLRYIFLELEWPNSLLDIYLLDSRVFASSVVNASFGDLILNLTILCTISWYVLKHYFYSSFLRKILISKGIKRSMLSTVFLLAYLFLIHWLYLFFQTIYHNSQLSYDINDSILFDESRITGILVYLIFVFLILILSHICLRSSFKLLTNRMHALLALFVASFLFSLTNLILDQSFILSLSIASILFIVLHFGRMLKSMNKLSYEWLLYLFTLMICLSILGSFAVYEFENEREFDKKKKFANQFLIDNDHMAEYLLANANDQIKNDIFIKSRMASPFLSKDVIESKIRQVYLNDYFDRYDIKISTYDVNGESFSNNTVSEVSLNKLDVNNYKTGYDGIYFINLQDQVFTKRYLDYIEIKRRGLKVGSIVIDLRLKRIIPENVYPELLVDNRYLSPYQKENYSFAVFENNIVMYSSGDFNYNQKFINSNFLDINKPFEFKGYKHVVVGDQSGHKIVVSSNEHPSSDIISNFSFLFLLKVFVLLVLTLFYASIIWFKGAQLTYSARIQLYLNVAFFLPLFAVSITTLSMINSSFEKEVLDEYYKKAEYVGRNINKILSDYVNEITDKDELNRTVQDIAKYSDTDINVFDIRGMLLTSNQPAIYENELLSKMVDYGAFKSIILDGDKSFTAKQEVGELEYNTTYFGVKSFENGESVGLISIPFFDSETALLESQTIVITNIINVFTIVFIAFLVISYFATEWLTFPLNFITQKLKRTSLTEFNEPLVWNSDDEIGMMVGEYNRMLINLDESKRALARSEKQSAWREIAQQVAHEIKNPLTPMKLTLQHLSRTLIDKEKSEEKLKPINSLLKQIDILDDIASSFSSFAKMPIPESEKYELSSLISHTVDLHQSTENLDLSLQLPNEKVYTIGDEQLMGRIVSNLILNAIQSINLDKKLLEIKLEVLKSKAVLSVKDNGSGIDEEIQQKIFIPNFTTKETGSGIGLAIAKHGIENAGGKIWFETEKDKGTTFFIELPTVGE